MSVNDKTPGPVSPSRRRAHRLRMIGIIVLVLGLGGAGLVYWIGTHTANVNDDPSMLGFNRAEQRQMGQLYGSQGLLIEQWSEDLKQPGTQAVIIAMVSTFVAAGCLYFARLLDYDDEAG
jgi:hypothetical protein